jgi:alcohol dehydrogenase YqhD (iron-dependent ADH family)
LLKKKIDFILAVGGGSMMVEIYFWPLILKETQSKYYKKRILIKGGAIWNCLNFACNRKRNELCVVTIESTKEKLAFEDPLPQFSILTLRSSNLYRKDN